MIRRSQLLPATLALLLPAAASYALLLGDAGNGEWVHADKCAGCHVSQFGGDGTSVYTRENRKVNTIEGLMGQVEACNQATSAGLTPEQVDDVVAYLATEHYRFE